MMTMKKTTNKKYQKKTNPRNRKPLSLLNKNIRTSIISISTRKKTMRLIGKM